MHIAIAEGDTGKAFFQSAFATAEEEQAKGLHKGWKILRVEKVVMTPAQEVAFNALSIIDALNKNTFFRDWMVYAFERGYRSEFMGPIPGIHELDATNKNTRFFNLFLRFRSCGMVAYEERTK
jgi:hypothetical protein